MLETLALMGHGFVNAMSLSNLLFMAGGTAIGIIIGCLPGLSAAMGVALLLPMTFTMAPETGLIVLGAIYCGAIFGGSISAILIHTPGTPASAATAIEGYQLTLQGKAGKALAVACFSSFCGGLLSCISLYFFAPLLAQPDHHCGRGVQVPAEGPDLRCAGPAAVHHRHGPHGGRSAVHVRTGFFVRGH